MGLLSKIKGNLGSGMPPMISRSGNTFTLRDAAGNERAPVHAIDVVFVDGNANVSRIYREDRNYDPKDPLPPDCFSDNGEAPSRFSLKPQHDNCHTCEWRKRGSATSKVDGKPISACSENQKLAVIVRGDQPMMYQLLITPGNLKAFREYVRSVEGQKYEAEEVVTRISFVPKSMGLLAFEAIEEVDDDTKKLISGMAGSDQARFVTGETDEPIGALPKPAERPALTSETQQMLAQQNVAAQLEPKTGPTREQLEAQLKAMREKEKAPKPKLVEAAPPPADTQGRTDPPKDVPAFLRKRDAPPSNSAFGMTADAPPPPDEVGKLIDQQTNGQAAPTLAARVTKAFGLPLRQ
jgi:hypothetical protein